jgi:hypothetical protein
MSRRGASGLDPEIHLIFASVTRMTSRPTALQLLQFEYDERSDVYRRRRSCASTSMARLQ